MLWEAAGKVKRGLSPNIVSQSCSKLVLQVEAVNITLHLLILVSETKVLGCNACHLVWPPWADKLYNTSNTVLYFSISRPKALMTLCWVVTTWNDWSIIARRNSVSSSIRAAVIVSGTYFPPNLPNLACLSGLATCLGVSTATLAWVIILSCCCEHLFWHKWFGLAHSRLRKILDGWNKNDLRLPDVLSVRWSIIICWLQQGPLEEFSPKILSYRYLSIGSVKRRRGPPHVRARAQLPHATRSC